jgi:hypothetical protein
VLSEFGELVDNDWRYVDTGARALAVKVLWLETNRASLWVAFQRGTENDGLQVIADSEGNEVKTYPGWDLLVQEVVVARTAEDSPWRIDAAPSHDSGMTKPQLYVLGFDWLAEDL